MERNIAIRVTRVKVCRPSGWWCWARGDEKGAKNLGAKSLDRSIDRSAERNDAGWNYAIYPCDILLNGARTNQACRAWPR